MTHNIQIMEVKECGKKSAMTREILESLPEWFGNKRAIEEYVEAVREFPYWAAVGSDGRCVGFFSVRIHYGQTGDIFVCGVRKEYHHRGVGTALYRAAEAYFIREGCKYVIVKTLSDAVDCEPYARTRDFYRSIGFEPLITLTEMWDEKNLCLIMFKNLR